MCHSALANVKAIAAQTEEDAGRFVIIGADPQKVNNLGNIKFDVEITFSTLANGLAIKAELFKNRFVWLIASTHKDEEKYFLIAIKS